MMDWMAHRDIEAGGPMTTFPMTSSADSPVAAIVVTYNRKGLLMNCMSALRGQSVPLAQIIVVDNASTDGTGQWLAEQAEVEEPPLSRVELPLNRGGAGGFKAGLEAALKTDCRWLWLMDDDAEPDANALAQMLMHCGDKTWVLGSMAACPRPDGLEICWPPVSPAGAPLRYSGELPGPRMEVDSLPFLGFMIHRDLVERGGLPDEDFFLSCDDVEYCERLKEAGARFFLVRDSVIAHPLPDRRILRLFGHTLILVRQAAWKNYYNARNRLIVARRYHGRLLWTATLPSVIVRMLYAAVYGPQSMQQIAAFAQAILHGLLGRVGKRAAMP
jgi:GT2 family glycosyltransferase